MHTVRTEGCLALLSQQPQMIRHVDAPHHKHAALDFDFADRLRREPALACWYLTRLQRAPEGAGQSARRGGDEVVEGCGVGRVHLGIDTVVLGHLGMDTEEDRLWFHGEKGAAQRAFHALDAHPRTIGDGISHGAPPAVGHIGEATIAQSGGRCI
jgi:hypothetical protein